MCWFTFINCQRNSNILAQNLYFQTSVFIVMCVFWKTEINDSVNSL